MSNFEQFLAEQYFPEDDKFNAVQSSDTRRPRITFKHLGRLRKIRELKKLEIAAHREFVRTMYGRPKDDSSGF